MPKTDTQQQLITAVRDLSGEVAKLKKLEFLRVFAHPWKFMWFSFLKGLMVGFGTVLGASVLVAIFVYLVGQISFVPILGDLVEDVLIEIQSAQTPRSNGLQNPQEPAIAQP